MKRNSLNLLGRGGRDRTDDLMLPKPHTLWQIVKNINDIADRYCTFWPLFRSFYAKGTHLGYTLFLILFLVPPCNLYADEWTREDTYREVAYLALHVADWGQTLEIADHPEKWHEHNPVLGSHPSRGEVNAWFIATGLLHPVVSYALPRPYREIWQYSTIVLEIGVTAHNASIGIGIGF